jgi:hypothetical protein
MASLAGIDAKATLAPVIMRFRGWLPAVTGRLSYSFFGLTRNPSVAATTNVADRDSRYVCVQQTRDTGDALFNLKRFDRKLHFCFLAKTDGSPENPQDHLNGRVYIFLKANWKAAKPVINGFCEILENCRETLQQAPGERLTDLADVAFLSSLLHLNRLASFHIQVSISRSGTTELTLDPSLLEGPNAAVLRNAEQSVIDLSAQAFYFLKDIGHRHQHHNSRTDTITDIHRIADNGDDLRWREDTLYNMYRKIIDFKRHPENLNFNDCLGLLAYAEAFDKISAEELNDTMSGARLPTYYYKQVADSIAATQSKSERKTEELQANEDKRLNILVTFFGLAIAYIGLMQFSDIPKLPPSPWLVASLSFLLGHPAFSIFMLLILIFTNKIYGLVPISSEFRDKLLRSFYPFSKIWPTIFFLLIGIAGAAAIENIFFGFHFFALFEQQLLRTIGINY